MMSRLRTLYARHFPPLTWTGLLLVALLVAIFATFYRVGPEEHNLSRHLTLNT